MRLVGAVLSSLVAVTLAAAQPAKQDPKDKAKPAATKAEQPKKEAAPKKDVAKKDAAPAKDTKKDAKSDTKADPKAEKKAAPKPNPVAESYNAIPLAERIAIQNDLIWTGDYNGVVSGEFGDRAIAAVKAFQKRNGGKETGVLNPPERTALAAAAKPKQDNVGWRLVDDMGSGARIGVPLKLAPQAIQAIGGMRWSSARGEVSVESFRITQPGTTLPALFEKMKREPTGRKTDYSVLRPDFFVISGLQNLKKFYVRAQIRSEEVRGFTVQYDQAMDGIMEPVVVAMSSAYTAFPVGGTVAPPPRRKVEYASGVVVAPGVIVTSREALDGCYVTTVAGLGGADRIAEDKGTNLALLRVYAPDIRPVALGDTKAGDTMLIGVADPQVQSGGGAVSSVKARITDTMTLEPPPAAGFDGAAAMDASGKVVGLATVKTFVVAGPMPAAPPPASVIPAESIRKLLAENKLGADGNATNDAVKAAVVRVICVRK